MHLQGIGLKNIKVFKEKHWFNFSGITLFTGTNNSGKSTVINTMQMLQNTITSGTIDELLNTKFKVSANRSRYGSIASFINEETCRKSNYFYFIRKIGIVEYSVKVQIFEGIESYGMVEQIIAQDIHSKIEIFSIKVDRGIIDSENLYQLKINFKYFIDRFYLKCQNSEKLTLRLDELDDILLKIPNTSNKSGFPLKNELEALAKEFSVYIEPIYSAGIDDDGNTEFSWMYRFLGLENAKCSYRLDDIKVLFPLDSTADDFITDLEYKGPYSESCKDGIFNLEKLTKDNFSLAIELQSLICNHYKNSKSDSFKLFCNDILSFLSDNIYYIKSRKLNDDNIIKSFINDFSDFGFKYLFTSSNYLLYSQNFQICDIIYLKTKDCSNEFIELCKNVKSLLSGHDFYNQELMMPEVVYGQISREIGDKLLNLNLGFQNIYVSSSRFSLKRTGNLNDETDFTSFLKLLEESNPSCREKEMSFINDWIKKFDLADEFIFELDFESSNYKAYLKTNKKKMLLADYGLGTNQLLPIIFSLSIHEESKSQSENYKPRTVIIEEPEANLHPELQSKLAELFLDAYNRFNVQVIVETHSEYIIKKLQYLVASKNMKPQDVLIHYFYKPKHSAVLKGEVNQVEKIEIDKNGVLSKDLGTGFLDESINLSFDILKSKNLN